MEHLHPQQEDSPFFWDDNVQYQYKEYISIPMKNFEISKLLIWKLLDILGAIYGGI